MTAPAVDIRVEDMPSLEESIPCGSTYATGESATLRLASTCCKAWRDGTCDGTPAVKFICVEHYDKWLQHSGHALFYCTHCGLKSHNLSDFATYKAMS